MKNKKLLVIFSGTIILFSIACRHTPEIPDSPSIRFTTEIKPIIVSNCAKSGCHDGNSNFGLTTYNEISKQTSAGDAHKSSLYTTVVKRSMPPSTPLTNEQAKLIYIWIMQGAKNN